MITVLFSCDGCGLKKHPVQVPARETEDHDVVHYVKQVVAQCVNDEHRRVSPQCESLVIKDLMIPIEGAEFIGQQVE